MRLTKNERVFSFWWVILYRMGYFISKFYWLNWFIVPDISPSSKTLLYCCCCTFTFSIKPLPELFRHFLSLLEHLITHLLLWKLQSSINIYRVGRPRPPLWGIRPPCRPKRAYIYRGGRPPPHSSGIRPPADLLVGLPLYYFEMSIFGWLTPKFF